MTTPSTSAAYFDRVAPQWEQMRGGFFTEAVRTAAIAKAHLHPEMTVADIGAGAGFIAAGLAPLARRVHVVDASAAMLAEARKNLAAFDNIEYHTADGLSLPLADASLDAVFANMYLHHCPDPLAAIIEMTRVLRPGGRLVLTDLDTHSHQWLKTEMADVWLGFEREQLRAWFAAAGLVNVFVDCTNESCQATRESGATEFGATERGATEHAAISIFVAVGTRRIGARQAVQESYGARAEAGCGCGDGNCCSPGTLSLDDVGLIQWDGGYTLTELSAIPQEAAQFSLGCGNPIAMAALRPGETVLDIGSGGGIDVFLAAQRVGPSGFVYGIDMTPAMLARAIATAAKNGYTNVEFRQGYAEQMPVADESVDVIISNCVINLTEDKGKVFREAFRVLKPGGRLEVNDMVFGGPVLPLTRYSAAGWSECVSGALPEQEYLDLVRQAGFEDIRLRRSTSQGYAAGADIYSAQVSALKPGSENKT